MTKRGAIRVGIGGWTYEPWDESFYPKGLAKKRQLDYASRALKVIEVNGTYYSSQKPETFAKWAAEVPDGFIFSLKASRFATNKKVLADAGESVDRFLQQGIAELGDRLGPILWQFMPTKKFDPADFGAFLALLPRSLAGLPLRHAVEVRHPSFQVPDFIALLRKHQVAVVCADHADYPLIPDVTADFVYARLQTGLETVETCYEPARMKQWAERLEDWAAGRNADGLALIAPEQPIEAKARDVFAFFIHEGKSRAPAGAQALQALVDKA
ncbi:hypothetical protein BJF93_09510 [Xaviernesmea oryzae]|uniref:DUF72 domain-containing protein n=1 Tax=Xaviernesmea oryzae TaxID=464029 RepID=A0A1Q9AWK6_9HYPH|nr:DUF72 domain-containing protein [Xaviernesmea oryzae]OLP59842.1 hypothetical protein BJF93_09510 [Xaviernesmea oryzae]SEK49442.1 Uncharacterized conserved protein YecE, DUF72 family [Xaviernesmea oryzae]